MDMITFEEALDLTLSRAVLFDTEQVAFSQSVGRVLAEDLFSDISMPPFNKSAMDGYACRREDLAMDLEIIAVIQAGSSSASAIGSGQCAQIMTGAMLPEGADTVIMVEETRLTDEGKVRFTGQQTKTNVCYLGEDVQAGDRVMDKGTLIAARHIPVMATIGATNPLVYRMPAISVVATGTELVEPDQQPGLSQIRNSNAAQMLAQLNQLGWPTAYFGIAPDDEDQTCDILDKALKDRDILILSGGVSMGEFDFVPAVIRRLGFDILYQKLAVQPGKPTTFAVRGRQFIFGLPGNPVSSFIQLEILVKPFIYQCMGLDYRPVEWKLPAGQEFRRKKTDRMAWIPVSIDENGRVMPLEYHGSAHIFALTRANGLIYFKIGQSRIEEGELVHVRPV